MKAVLFLALVLAVASQAATLDRLHKKWDIAEGITFSGAFFGKQESHERTLIDAIAPLSADEKKALTEVPLTSTAYLQSVHFVSPLTFGIQYPDMPEVGKGGMEGLGNDMTKPDRITPAFFATQFSAAENGKRDTLTAQSHFGCLQTWHGMAPVSMEANEGNTIVWTNGDVRDIITNLLEGMWNAAVAAKNAGNKGLAEFHIGRMSHTFGDSFAPGHTIRESECGAIVTFQGYDAQSHQKKPENYHSSSDHHPTKGNNPDKRVGELFDCSVKHIRNLVKAWIACVRINACAFPANLVASVFYVSPSSVNSLAGGAANKFQDEATATVSRSVTFPLADDMGSTLYNNICTIDKAAKTCTAKIFYVPYTKDPKTILKGEVSKLKTGCRPSFKGAFPVSNFSPASNDLISVLIKK